MTQILVLGGGFAGMACAARVRRAVPGCRVLLIDQRVSREFLPLLPDIIGRGISATAVQSGLPETCRRHGVEFLRRCVTAVDTAARKVYSGEESFAYDYLVVATGTETNFYGNTLLSQQVFKLDCAADAAALAEAVRGARHEHYLVIGGGYTGIEIATNIRRHLIRTRRNASVLVVERQPSILGPLPVWMKEYVGRRLARWRIEVETGASLEKMEGDTAFLSSGKMFPRALVVWAAGVRTSAFVQAMPFEKNPQGRIKVDGTLRAQEHCFLVGDAGLFTPPGEAQPLRMAVQFAISQGEYAAYAISKLQQGLVPVPYVPFDPGYIIPLADNSACGNVLGIPLRGVFPLGLHYALCIARSFGMMNKWRVLRDVLRHPA